MIKFWVHLQVQPSCAVTAQLTNMFGCGETPYQFQCGQYPLNLLCTKEVCGSFLLVQVTSETPCSSWRRQGQRRGGGMMTSAALAEIIALADLFSWIFPNDHLIAVDSALD